MSDPVPADHSSDSSLSDTPNVKAHKDVRDLALPTVAIDATTQARPGMWASWKRGSDEPWARYALRMCREGHSVPDAFLTVAGSQIGQIMLTTPNALWKAGLISGGLFSLVAIVCSIFTTYLMNVLYLERKRRMLAAGTWAKASQHVTQYHDVLGFFLGKQMRVVVQIIICLQLLGTGIAQVIACAADWYSIDKTHSKRELQVIWGAVLQVFVLFPSFKHFRILNIAALAGTTMTAIYILHETRVNGFGDINHARLWPADQPNGAITAPQYFFTGCAVLLNALGGHSIMIEMMDAMESPKQYTTAYTGGWLWTIFLVVPHSIAVNLSFPKLIGGADNVYGLLPMSKAKVASVALMIIHQLAAFAYYVLPAIFMWERLIKTHTRPWYIRLPSRLPVSLFIWAIAMAFPFYGAINSLMASVSVPFTAFALPALTFALLYRTQDNRQDAVLPPFSWLRVANWAPALLLSVFIVVFYLGFGFAAISYSLKTIVDNSRTYGILARCYQCPPNYESLLRPGNGGL
ncbi:transmembrane amino acid transporter protein-domain-containing protein [Haematococcus lacustris]